MLVLQGVEEHAHLPLIGVFAELGIALAHQAPDAVDWSIRHISLVSDNEFGRAGGLLDRHKLAAFIYQPFSLVPLKVFVDLAARDNLAPVPMLLFIAVGRSLRNVMAGYAGAWLGRRFPTAIEKRWRELLYLYVPIAGTLVAWSMVRS